MVVVVALGGLHVDVQIGLDMQPTKKSHQLAHLSFSPVRPVHFLPSSVVHRLLLLRAGVHCLLTAQ